MILVQYLKDNAGFKSELEPTRREQDHTALYAKQSGEYEEGGKKLRQMTVSILSIAAHNPPVSDHSISARRCPIARKEDSDRPLGENEQSILRLSRLPVRLIAHLTKKKFKVENLTHAKGGRQENKKKVEERRPSRGVGA